MSSCAFWLEFHSVETFQLHEHRYTILEGGEHIYVHHFLVYTAKKQQKNKASPSSYSTGKASPRTEIS